MGDEVDYRFSDWKFDNESIVTKFEDTKVEIGAKMVEWLKSVDLEEIKLKTIGKKEKYKVLVPTIRVLSTLNN